MSAEFGQSGSEHSVKQENQPTSAERAALQIDLEERLATARIERARVLAEKGAIEKKPPVTALAFRDSAAKTSDFAPKLAAPKTSAVSVPAQAGHHSASGLLATDRNPATASINAEARQGWRIPLPVVVAFAAFFGLGFGMVLSLGLVVGLGWVSLSDLKNVSFKSIALNGSTVPLIVFDGDRVALAALDEAPTVSGVLWSDLVSSGPFKVAPSLPGVARDLGQLGSIGMSPAPQPKVGGHMDVSFPPPTQQSDVSVTASEMRKPTVFRHPAYARTRAHEDLLPIYFDSNLIEAAVLSTVMSSLEIDGTTPTPAQSARTHSKYGGKPVLMRPQNDLAPIVADRSPPKPTLTSIDGATFGQRTTVEDVGRVVGMALDVAPNAIPPVHVSDD
ncbi:hypothetical protein [uncultured Roseobacter sp.]|uniref:hypothetical protein n=1 Tax=uncultured Roseobacter sp. TaxID=114847 RepID=UPI00262BC070|nr:hypothetical protein [uncultured Roseobacter sp.]